MQKFTDKYSLSLKSLCKTISPFLTYLPWLTWWNLWVVQCLYSSLEMWFEFLWHWLFSPIYTWLYICLHKPMRWQGSNVDGSWMFKHPRVLQCLSCGSSPKSQNDICCPVLFHNSIEPSNPTKASGMLMI
jgi:hypothetical protein